MAYLRWTGIFCFLNHKWNLEWDFLCMWGGGGRKHLVSYWSEAPNYDSLAVAKKMILRKFECLKIDHLIASSTAFTLHLFTVFTWSCPDTNRLMLGWTVFVLMYNKNNWHFLFLFFIFFSFLVHLVEIKLYMPEMHWPKLCMSACLLGL